ncbi:MAG: alpha-isopropylmalate synthase regulatory domain-containing protein [Bacteroidota bacterium]|nr:alpha-isopropylmalate synthase regulatory domain-containing protein [Bacteroidota bacterium]
MDTTLRDGEQTSGVSFTDTEKLTLAKMLLEELNVNRIEIASARVSDGEFQAVRKITEWAASKDLLDKVEILGFVDGKISIDWIKNAGGEVINLLCKGSYRHVTEQLRRSPEEHVADIRNSIAYAAKNGLRVNIYLEDWSNGMRNSKDYVFYLLDQLKDEKIDRFMLPDTLGILGPDETFDYCKEMLARYPELHFDFHAHNDYDLAIANVYKALKAGIDCVHTTVNGLGERAGNAPLSSVIGLIMDHLHLETTVDESRLTKISRLVETFSGIRIPENKPLIGENVFTQCSGVHADGDNKNKLYYNDLVPERFGRKRQYALGKTSGKANIKKNLEEIGINLDADALRRVTEKIIELGDHKETVTTDDLPYIVSDILKSEAIGQRIRFTNYIISHAKNLHPSATVSLEIDNEKYEANSPGDGQYDAFMNALKKIYFRLNKPFPQLVNYTVTIPPGGRTDALVETVITWKLNREFKTRGLETDQTSAAITATEKMLNVIENDFTV